MYWFVAGGKLFDALDLLYRASEGIINLYNHPRIQNIGRYIEKVFIGKKWFVNFADAIPCPLIQATVIYRYGMYIHDAKLTDFGKSHLDFLYEAQKYKWFELNRLLSTFFFTPEQVTKAISEPQNQTQYIMGDLLNHHRITFFPSTEVFIGRSEDQRLFLAAKGGHNQESHNHNDIGNFIIYLDN